MNNTSACIPNLQFDFLAVEVRVTIYSKVRAIAVAEWLIHNICNTDTLFVDKCCYKVILVFAVHNLTIYVHLHYTKQCSAALEVRRIHSPFGSLRLQVHIYCQGHKDCIVATHINSKLALSCRCWCIYGEGDFLIAKCWQRTWGEVSAQPRGKIWKYPVLSLCALVSDCCGELLLLTNLAIHINIIVEPNQLVALYKSSPCDGKRHIAIEVKHILHSNIYCHTFQTICILIEFNNDTTLACYEVVIHIAFLSHRFECRSLVATRNLMITILITSSHMTVSYHIQCRSLGYNLHVSIKCFLLKWIVCNKTGFVTLETWIHAVAQYLCIQSSVPYTDFVNLTVQLVRQVVDSCRIIRLYAVCAKIHVSSLQSRHIGRYHLAYRLTINVYDGVTIAQNIDSQVVPLAVVVSLSTHWQECLVISIELHLATLENYAERISVEQICSFIILLLVSTEPHLYSKVIAIACCALCQVDSHCIVLTKQSITCKVKSLVLVVQVPVCRSQSHVTVAGDILCLHAKTFIELPITDKMLGSWHLGLVHLCLKVGHINSLIPKCYLVDSTCESITQGYHTIAFIFLDRQLLSKIYCWCIISIKRREVRSFTILVETECHVNPLVSWQCMLIITYNSVYREVVIAFYLLNTQCQLGLSITMTEDSTFTTYSYPHIYGKTLTTEVDVCIGLCDALIAACCQ